MRQTLIFCHLPKASGTTLRAILFREYQRDRIFSLDGRDAEKSILQYRKLSKLEKEKYDLIEGHYPVGLHNQAPSPSTYITLIRDPVERVISHYYHVLRDADHYAYTRGFQRGMSLLEYIQSGATRREIENGQVGFLSGGQWPVDESSLEIAKRNLENLFVVVGLTERFDQSIILMRRKLNWKKMPVYFRRHVANNRPYTSNIPLDALSEIKKLNRFDEELYKYASKRLDEAIEQEGNEFISEFQKFRVINSLYQRLKEARFLISKLRQQVRR